MGRRDFARVEDALRDALHSLDNPSAVEEEPVYIEPTVEHRVIRKPVHHIPLHQHRTIVRYSVREQWGGHRFTVEFVENTISEFAAKSNAERQMKQHNYIEIVHLDTVRT